MKFILLFLFLMACSSKKHETPERWEPPANLVEQADLYRSLAKSGFVEPSSCDSLLFSGLAGAAGLQVDLLSARRQDGRWERRPLSQGPCFPTLSKSSISRDMLLGVLWWAWRERRPDVLEDLFQYAVSHDLVLGEHDGSLDGRARVLATPALLSVLARAVEALGGPHHRLADLPLVEFPVPRGFQRHLQALLVGLDREVTGSLSDHNRSLLEAAAEDDPLNPLFPAVLGDKDLAAELLTKGWPAGKLPSGENWCEVWKPQRADDDPSLKPCPEKGTFSGADFLFVYSLLVR